MEEGADEKLQREVEEELRLAELERLMMQEEQASGDIQVIVYEHSCDRLNFLFFRFGLFHCAIILTRG